MDINFKIEAKQTVNIHTLKNFIPELNTKQIFELLYKTFDTDFFMLKYKVRKLSKKARRN